MKYSVKTYIHGAELVSPDGDGVAFFANRSPGQKDGAARAEEIANALNDQASMHEQIEAADREIAAQKERADATERIANALRSVLPAAEKWAALEACRLSGKPLPMPEDARAVPEWAACLEAHNALDAVKRGAVKGGAA